MVQWPHGIKRVSGMPRAGFDARVGFSKGCIRMSKADVDAKTDGVSNRCNAALEFRCNRQHAYRPFRSFVKPAKGFRRWRKEVLRRMNAPFGMADEWTFK